MSGIFDALHNADEEQKRNSRIYGVRVAIVTNNNDPMGKGRVKLKYPWYSDNTETGWVRMATPMAGNQMGIFFLPEVDDEVLVVFDDGDINKPYILGSLWNGTDKAPITNGQGQKNNLRQIKSRSGHTLTFDDNTEEKKAKLEILTAAGNTIELNDEQNKEKVTIKSKSGHTIELNDEQNSAGTKISSQGGHSVHLDDKNQKLVATDSTGNKVEMKSDGMEIADANGNSIKLSASGVDVNGKLTVMP